MGCVANCVTEAEVDVAVSSFGFAARPLRAAALSIRTTYTSPGQVPPYEDAEGPDGLLRYKYRGQKPDHPGASLCDVCSSSSSY